MIFKSGFVTIIGRPNVGKSTLMNKIIGEKIAIMTDKPQTTRNRIQAIYNDKSSQIIFLDTPGIHKPKNKLGEYMVKTAKETLNEVDVVLFMVDESKTVGPGDRFILDYLEGIKTPVIVVINKIDLLDPMDYKNVFEFYSSLEYVKNVVGISALNGNNIGDLMGVIDEYLEEGPMYYPSDMITDQPERAIVSEIIREKALLYLEDEVPHGVNVQIELMKKRDDKDIVDIQATIICEKSSHKGIIIGKQGRKLKGIGMSARKEIERLLGSKIFLELWVKVRPGWRDNEGMLKNYGYNSQNR